MSQFVATLPNLTITSGTSTSTSTPPGILNDALAVMIITPATLTTAVKIQVSQDAGVTFGDLLLASDGAVLTSMTQAQARVILNAAFDSLRVTGVAISEATNRTITITKAFSAT